MARASELAMEEASWQEVTGLSIEEVKENDKVTIPYYEVRQDNRTTLHSSVHRHECRAYIEGYIQGRLDALKQEVDRRLEDERFRSAQPK